MQLSSRIFGRKAPFDPGAGDIARFLQLLDFTLERLFISETPVQALTTQDTQLDFRHVQPTAVLRRVVKLQFAQDASGFFWREPLIERRRLVRVQVVHHDPHPLGFREAFIHQPLHLLREILHRPLPSHLNVPPSTFRLTEHKQVADTLSLIFIIEPLDFPDAHRQRLPRFANQLCARLIEADHRQLFVIFLNLQVEHIFHAGHELGIDLADTPLLFQPGFKFVFLSTWRTVSRAMEEANFNSTTLSASKQSVQRAPPSGGVLHAKATRCASCLPVNLRACPRRGLSFKHSRLSSTKRRRVRSTVLMPQPRAATICSSVEPEAANSRMRARVTLRWSNLTGHKTLARIEG